jgi:hypothetical protein
MRNIPAEHALTVNDLKACALDGKRPALANSPCMRIRYSEKFHQTGAENDLQICQHSVMESVVSAFTEKTDRIVRHIAHGKYI